MTAAQRYLIATIFSLTVMVGVGTSTMPPALAAVQRIFGIGPDASGVLLSVFTLPGLVLTPLLGYVADRLGRRAVVVLSLVVFAVGGLAALAAQTFEHLVVVRLVQGIGAASLGALNVALISDFFEGQQRVRLLGFNHSVLSVGTAILPVVSGQLAAFEWRLPFVLPAAGILVAMAIVVFVPPASARAHEAASVGGSVRWRSLGVLLVVSAVTYALLFGPFLNYLQERIARLDPAAPNLYQRIGTMIGTMSVATTLGALFVGRLARRIMLVRMLQTACVLYGLALVLFVVMPSYELLFVPTVVFGLAQAFNQPVVQALVAALAPAMRSATVLSLNRMAALVGQTLGPIAFGVVWRIGGLSTVFIVGAVVAVACAVAVALVKSPSLESSPQS
jgi:MFS family permease